jgi:hypothetical protein
MRLLAFRTSILECRAFAAKFHTILPLELRDLVYEYAWTEEYVRKASEKWHKAVRGPSQALGKPWHRAHYDPLYQNFHYKRMLLWILPPFVGLQVAKEAAAVYYRNLPASIVSGHHIHRLRKFLTRDHLFLGVTPGHHLRKLSLTISLSQCRKLAHARLISHNGLHILQKNFDCLPSTLKNKNNFRLNIAIGEGLGGDQLFRILDAIRPACLSLREEGVDIVVRGYPNSARIICDVTDLAFPVDGPPSNNMSTSVQDPQ